MKKIIVCLTFICASVITFGQSFKTLKTDDGNRTLSISKDGKSSITFKRAEWAEMFPTQKTSVARACLHIANRHQECNGGIGFRCGIFDCPILPNDLTVSRDQPVVISYTDTSVVVTFQNIINWDFLSL